MNDYEWKMEQEQERELARSCGMNFSEASNYTPSEMQSMLREREPVDIYGDEYEPAPIPDKYGMYESVDSYGHISYTSTPPLRLTKKLRAELYRKEEAMNVANNTKAVG